MQMWLFRHLGHSLGRSATAKAAQGLRVADQHYRRRAKSLSPGSRRIAPPGGLQDWLSREEHRHGKGDRRRRRRRQWMEEQAGMLTVRKENLDQGPHTLRQLVSERCLLCQLHAELPGAVEVRKKGKESCRGRRAVWLPCSRQRRRGTGTLPPSQHHATR